MNSINTLRVQTATRLAYGLLFTVFGLNGFLSFLPQPPVNEAGGAFLGALAATGYMFPLMKGIEVLAGVLLLSNRAAPFALVLLAPIVVNIAAFHLLLQPGIGMALLVVAMQTGLAYTYRTSFSALFHRSVQTDRVDPIGQRTRLSQPAV